MLQLQLYDCVTLNRCSGSVGTYWQCVEQKDCMQDQVSQSKGLYDCLTAAVTAEYTCCVEHEGRSARACKHLTGVMTVSRQTGCMYLHSALDIMDFPLAAHSSLAW